MDNKRLLSSALLLIGLAVAFPARAHAFSNTQIEQVAAGLEERRQVVLTKQLRRPFPAPACRSQANNDPCILGQLNLALVELYLQSNTTAVDDANRQIEATLARLAIPGWMADFHGVKAGLLFRMVMLFGRDGVKQAHLIRPEIEDAIVGRFVEWASVTCTLNEAARTDVWEIWGSENHGAQRDGACWDAAVLAKSHAQYHDHPYNDGSLPEQQYEKWTVYLKKYIRSRGKSGVLIEYFSPTYAQYTLSPFYNYADFGEDTELRKLARSLLDLWWASWAQEQIDGVHGGSKARAYPILLRNGAPMTTASYLYFGIGASAELPPGQAPAVTSGYVPPPVVTSIAVDTHGRGSYVVYTRAPGLQRSPPADSWYHLEPKPSDIVRTAYVAPDFIMGSALQPKLRGRAWSAISCQNRWSGVIVSGAVNERVVVAPASSRKDRSNCNAFWSVQSKSAIIAQLLRAPYGINVGAMRIWVGDGFRRQEQDNWLLLDGSAYVGVRPAWGGYTWDPADSHFLVPTDANAPVIIQAASRSDFASLDEFRAALLANRLTIDEGVISYQGLAESGLLTFYTASDRLPDINGRPVDLDPPYTFSSPFVNQAKGSGLVKITKDGLETTLDFGD